MSADEERLHRLVDQAVHDSVSVESLTEKKAGLGRPRLSDRPLITYLKDEEQPHFIFYADRNTPNFHGPDSPRQLQRSRRYEVMHMVTDSRWIMVAGNRNGDDAYKLSLPEIEAVNYTTEGWFANSHLNSLSRNKVVLDTGTAYFEIPISGDFDQSALEKLCTYLHNTVEATPDGVDLDPDEAGYTVDGVDSYQPDRETVARLLDEVPEAAQNEADEIVRDSEDVGTLVTQLNELIEEYEEPEQSLEGQIQDAESFEELRRGVESPAERAQRRAGEHAEQVQYHAREQIDDVWGTVREGDPREAGRWARSVGIAARPIASALPAPTLPLQLVLLAGGGALGAYSSSNKNSILEEVNPDELAKHAVAMSEVGIELEHIDGEAVGALLGISSYLGRTLPPEEYSKWIIEADPETILKGAELGAAHAQALEDSKRSGALAGAGLGLAHSYSGGDLGETHTDFRESLDDDLYKHYLEELSKRGRTLPD